MGSGMWCGLAPPTIGSPTSLRIVTCFFLQTRFVSFLQTRFHIAQAGLQVTMQQRMALSPPSGLHTMSPGTPSSTILNPQTLPSTRALPLFFLHSLWPPCYACSAPQGDWAELKSHLHPELTMALTTEPSFNPGVHRWTRERHRAWVSTCGLRLKLVQKEESNRQTTKCGGTRQKGTQYGTS